MEIDDDSGEKVVRNAELAWIMSSLKYLRFGIVRRPEVRGGRVAVGRGVGLVSAGGATGAMESGVCSITGGSKTAVMNGEGSGGTVSQGCMKSGEWGKSFDGRLVGRASGSRGDTVSCNTGGER